MKKLLLVVSFFLMVGCGSSSYEKENTIPKGTFLDSNVPTNGGFGTKFYKGYNIEGYWSEDHSQCEYCIMNYDEGHYLAIGLITFNGNNFDEGWRFFIIGDLSSNITYTTIFDTSCESKEENAPTNLDPNIDNQEIDIYVNTLANNNKPNENARTRITCVDKFYAEYNNERIDLDEFKLLLSFPIDYYDEDVFEKYNQIQNRKQCITMGFQDAPELPSCILKLKLAQDKAKQEIANNQAIQKGIDEQNAILDKQAKLKRDLEISRKMIELGNILGTPNTSGTINKAQEICFKTSESISGLNKICNYNCPASGGYAMTIRSHQVCSPSTNK